MDDKNSSNVQHPLHAALMIFHGTVRTAFETAAFCGLMTQNRHAAQDPSELQPAPVGLRRRMGVQVGLAADLR